MHEPPQTIIMSPRKAGKLTRLGTYLLACRKGYSGTMEQFETEPNTMRINHTTKDGYKMAVAIKIQTNQSKGKL